jgi:hypothetical protein
MLCSHVCGEHHGVVFAHIVPNPHAKIFMPSFKNVNLCHDARVGLLVNSPLYSGRDKLHISE